MGHGHAAEIYKKSYLGLDIAAGSIGGRSRIDIAVLAVLLTRAGAAIRDLRDFSAIVQEPATLAKLVLGAFLIRKRILVDFG
jgi:hypothetical protein